ncbi:SIR2 family protein [Paraneptunicella aestuarii]|uniref:SIR2 family protein n=1 Tax=Paraneptunicella aestuarii TaxID=2831148 RepID=UPI001E4F7C96|nr:SIR2 family protein [Paraneptunicella aestuarii]UAA38031.1 SIR2 family protein [Paraneptunicella aestuarii]
MVTLQDSDLEVLRRHFKALSHLRERKNSERIALFLGAGASKALGFPNWLDLVTRIENEPEFKDYQPNIGNNDLTVRTQGLLQHLIKKETLKDKQVDAASERAAKYKWLHIVHKCLYAETSIAKGNLAHPYLPSFLSLIKESPLTINYNFDDCIEQMLSQAYYQEQINNKEKVFETVWEPSTQYQRSKGVIYHPNGFLPFKLVEGYSDNIVFAESEFADQLIQTMHGHYSTLVSHLSRYTSLLIGLSLNDPTLKHLLRQNTQLNPGHVHYYLKYCNELPNEHSMKAEQEVNFEVYGVITIHLTDEEFSSFGRLLSCGDEHYEEFTDRLGLPVQRIYYVTGAVGAGKTTTVNKMKSLRWFGEWVESKPEELAKPHTELTKSERDKIDIWISEQFRKKDFKISGVKCGVVISDRSPLDPLAFAKENAIRERASQHLEILSPAVSDRRLKPGHIILLSASGSELLSRAKHRHNVSSEYFETQEKLIRNLYKEPNPTITEISTSNRSITQVVKQIAKVIHLNPYEEFDIHSRLEELSND